MVPSLFLAHGSPMLAIESSEYTNFLSALGNVIKPKAIVIFTAHWETETLTISSTDNEYETIYDFYGFPDELYAIRYPAKGSTQIASLVQERFEQHGIHTKTDTTRGLDHGSWTLLSRMYPDADIPVVQISVNPYLPAKQQFDIGQSLRGLGREDILVIGSGVTVHNLRIIKWGQTTAEPWAVEFDSWLIDKLEQGDLESLLDYENQAPHADLAVPRPEHFVPFYIALGSSEDLENSEVIHRSYDLGTLSYLCLKF